MKNTILILIFIASIIGSTSKFIYDKIEGLKSELLQVKKLNTKLKKNNTNLVKKQNTIKQKLKDRRTVLSKKKLAKAKYKIGKAAVGVIPFVGTGAVAALTYEEIKGYCEDLKEYKEFENSIFSNPDESIVNEEQILCGYDKNLIEKEVYKDLEEFKDDFSSVIGSQFNLLSIYLETKYNSFIKD
ncbi:hypothetical protein KO488_03585 [Poseidonibacter lekithochrous]|uniref:hypothetical protein n=1 Tax=Poseidonibacter TaxID=2321187 RepID=UPI001C08A5EC|nr:MULTISPECIES: hypothetical protein [Poseidonibacter]MBU3013825.1 hypothetical protein [Poseidonibacter lekithochrous]MDO6827121.1 hypothetical protein [Poseidonibacter sp. 1_MG-2023]